MAQARIADVVDLEDQYTLDLACPAPPNRTSLCVMQRASDLDSPGRMEYEILAEPRFEHYRAAMAELGRLSTSFSMVVQP